MIYFFFLVHQLIALSKNKSPGWLSGASNQFLDCSRSLNKLSSYFLLSVWCIPLIVSCIFFHLMLVQAGLSLQQSRKGVLLRACRHDHIRALLRPFRSIFDRSFFHHLPAVCPTDSQRSCHMGCHVYPAKKSDIMELSRV